MSRESLKFVLEIKEETVDLQMALQCAPLIAGLKIANMLSISRHLYDKVLAVLDKTDISCYILRESKEKVILLLYKKAEMQNAFENEQIRNFLYGYGYTEFDIESLLERFSERYCANMEKGEEFPHEFGVFLGYPLEDVQGFIQNRGQNCLHTGYWKVYKNLHEKVQLFQRFESAKENMIMLISSGMGMRDIIDAFQYEEFREAVG
jgi:hypothetical protein